MYLLIFIGNVQVHFRNKIEFLNFLEISIFRYETYNIL